MADMLVLTPQGVVPPPPPRPESETSPTMEGGEDGAAKRPAKKWPTVVAEGEGTEDLVEPVYEGDPSVDVTQPLDWDKACGYHRSADGAAGVFFVTIEGRVVVVKGTMTLAQEVFTAALAEKLGIRVPKVRIVKHYEEEMASLKRNLTRLAEMIGPADLVKVERELDRPFVMLMEYTGGKDLETLAPGWAGALLRCKGEAMECSRLRALGHLGALDMLTNNWDRMPFVWDNAGNWKNIVLHRGEHTWEIIGIDQGFTAIVVAEGMEKYTERIEKYITKLVLHPEKEASETKSVREILRGHTTYDIQTHGSLEIQRGIMEIVRKAAEMNESDFANLKQEVASQVTEDFNAVWETGMNNIDVGFLSAIAQVFRKCLSKA